MKKLIFIITLLVSTNVYALKQYWCSDEFSASNYNKCKDNGIEITFKVNVENQVVIQRIQKGMQTQTSSFEKCSVADKKNWVCTSKFSARTSGIQCPLFAIQRRNYTELCTQS